ncbi:MAG: hypothetical protein ABSD38_25285 [Syntrophorhabdales bacterium]|jgi:uncharacterized protein YoaH (UPF0181 family)
MPDLIAEELQKEPGKLVEYYVRAEKIIASEVESYKKELMKATREQMRADREAGKEELLSDRTALGISMLDPTRRKKLNFDIKELTERRDKLKGDLKTRTQVRNRLIIAIANNRVEADGWFQILEWIQAMLSQNTSGEAIKIVADIETSKARLRETRDFNREQSAPFMNSDHSTVGKTRIGARRPSKTTL